MSDLLSFDQIVQCLRPCTRAVGSGQQLVYPNEVHPFVPPNTTAEAGVQNPLASDVLLFTAPAAVGKSWFARSLAARAHVPFLNLASVRVATHSLIGALSAEMGSAVPQELQQGMFSLIIDALDEGKILSGEGNWEAFLRTTFEFLIQNPSPTGQGPKVLFFGRPEAIEWTKTILEDVSPAIPVSRVSINYFDEHSAPELVLAWARVASGRDLRNQESKVRKVIDAFFKAISAAITIPRERLWQEHHGQSFAGYAPVLAALGTLIGKTKNHQNLLEDLTATRGQADAWAVLEEVTRRILDRETHEKVQDKLRANHGNKIPQAAYDAADQLHHLANHLTGQSFSFSSGLPYTAFGSPQAQNDYMTAVHTHLKEHPFLRDEKPANDVLGALVLAEAIANGSDVLKGQGANLLAVYGRQPFLWRFVRRRFTPKCIDSGMVPYVLSSLWSDDMMAQATLSIHPDQATLGCARLVIVNGPEEVKVGIRVPLVLLREVRDLEVRLPTDEVVLRGWPGAGISAMEFLGKTRIRARALRFDVKNVSVGALDRPTECYLHAEDASGDQQCVLEVREGSQLTIKGVFENRYPWSSVKVTVDRDVPEDDPVWELLSECRRMLSDSVPVVVMQKNYDLPGGSHGGPVDKYVEWARKHGDLFPRLLRALVTEGFAEARDATTKGKYGKKVRVTPKQMWSELLAQLLEAYQNPDQMSTELRKVFQKLR
jgi:hypothetical protein